MKTKFKVNEDINHYVEVFFLHFIATFELQKAFHQSIEVFFSVWSGLEVYRVNGREVLRVRSFHGKGKRIIKAGPHNIEIILQNKRNLLHRSCRIDVDGKGYIAELFPVEETLFRLIAMFIKSGFAVFEFFYLKMIRPLFQRFSQYSRLSAFVFKGFYGKKVFYFLKNLYKLGKLTMIIMEGKFGKGIAFSSKQIQNKKRRKKEFSEARFLAAMGLALCCHHRGHFERSLEILKKEFFSLLKFHKINVDEVNDLAAVLCHIHRYRKEIGTNLLARIENKMILLFLLYVANLLMLQKNIESAENILEQLMPVYDKLALFWVLKSYLEYLKGNYHQSEKLMGKFIHTEKFGFYLIWKIFHMDDMIHMIVGLLYIQRKNYDSAKRCLIKMGHLKDKNYYSKKYKEIMNRQIRN